MENGLLLLIAKIWIKAAGISDNYFEFITINGRQYFSYYKSMPLKYIKRGGNDCWSHICKLNAENLTYLLNALNAQEG